MSISRHWQLRPRSRGLDIARSAVDSVLLAAVIWQGRLLAGRVDAALVAGNSDLPRIAAVMAQQLRHDLAVFVVECGDLGGHWSLWMLLGDFAGVGQRVRSLGDAEAGIRCLPVMLGRSANCD